MIQKEMNDLKIYIVIATFYKNRDLHHIDLDLCLFHTCHICRWK